MREIKFRAWDSDYNCMDNNFFIQASTGTAYETPSKTFDTPNIEIDENPNLIIMQFTGLQDKNGVDIYESDIIKSHFYGDEFTCIAEIKYDQSSAAYIYDSSEQDAFIYGAEQGVLEVIGNIHENKELL